MSLKDYFHLKRDAFDIDPKRDAAVYFGYQPLEERIINRLREDFVQQRHVPKFFIGGRYGSGKTHSLSHIRYVLTHDPEFIADFPTEPLLTEVPPLSRKESWRKMHEHLLDSVGRPLIKSAVQAVMSTPNFSGDVASDLRNADVLRFGDTSLQNSQAQIFRNLLFGGLQETISWEWLKGKQLNLDQASTLNTETNLTETSDLVNALLNVAALIWVGLKKKIVILLDEAEQIRSVTNPDSHQEFVWAFRRLVDDENDVLGLVVGFQQEGGMEAAPPIFSDLAIVTRVGGPSGFIDLSELVAEPNDVKEFVTAVLARLVDQAAAKVTIDTEGLSTEPEWFPFTPDASDRIAEHITEDPDRKSPREIKNLLARAVVAAWLNGRNTGRVQLVDADLLESVLYAGEEV
jgi:hypothetical protein